MDDTRFDNMLRQLTHSRRTLTTGTLAAVVGWLAAPGIDAKRKRKRKKKARKGLCRSDGAPCRTPGNNCKKQFCLNTPFTIEALGTQPLDGATYLFVPPQDATTGPAPYTAYSCNRDGYPCELEYPFACVDGVQTEVGIEVTSIYRLLPGRYEYWLEVPRGTPAGAVAVILNDNNGRGVQQWTNPAPDSPSRFGWHIFDIDGASGRVIAIDQLIDNANLPETAHDPQTYVCPLNT
jgi:hypothetical protein